MKVTREEGFKPITIVLETKEEADAIWNKLNNCKFSDSYQVYGSFSKTQLLAVASDMLRKFEQVHKP